MDGKHCKFCGRNNVKLTYSKTQEDYLCLECYKAQFPKKPYPANPDKEFLTQKPIDFEEIIWK